MDNINIDYFPVLFHGQTDNLSEQHGELGHIRTCYILDTDMGAYLASKGTYLISKAVPGCFRLLLGITVIHQSSEKAQHCTGIHLQFLGDIHETDWLGFICQTFYNHKQLSCGMI